MTHFKVAVRVRPLSQREIGLESTNVIEVYDSNIISITNLKVSEQNVGDSRERKRSFAFDYCFDHPADQLEIFNTIEKDVSSAIKNRYHSCVLTYGQSSSGKTHTMIGIKEDPGLIPRLCNNVFQYLQDYSRNSETDKTETFVSYLEIYNEKVRDLLSDADRFRSPNALKIREHPKKGPYVQGLTRHVACDSETILQWFEIGKANRSVAATPSNPQSSRSHSVFTLSFGDGVRLHLIDLAGSERVGSGRISASTFKEGANINKSLVALGNVISTLADNSTKFTPRKHYRRFIPYRDSILTWLLKDTLSGNSKTVLIATVSPSNTCYTETINTLRFGQNAKKIVSCPIVIEDPKERIIRELRNEIATLKCLLIEYQNPAVVINPEKFETKQNLKESFENGLKTDIYNKRVSATEDVAKNLTKITKVIIQNDFLLPIMEVKTNVKESVNPSSNMRRTLSVENAISGKPPKKSFGSLETIPATTVKDKQKRLSQPSLMRKNSFDKPKPTLKNVSSLKKAVTTKQSEKGVVTEIKGPQKVPALDLAKKSTIKPRSRIVEDVTNRLYGKVKKKEVATDTETLNPKPEEVPKELSICSNARLKLQELTRQALRAHRRKTIDTQTDLGPVLRVKETSTDVNDLKLALSEIKHASIGTVEVETKEAGVDCSITDFECNHENVKRSNLKITRSCGTQALLDVVPDPHKYLDQQQTQSLSSISFKKYLQQCSDIKNKIASQLSSDSSLTNFDQSQKLDQNVSGTVSSLDSLEEHAQHQNAGICFPDIISNHNSLEHGILSGNNDPPCRSQLEEQFAKSETEQEFLSNSDLKEMEELSSPHVPRFSLTPNMIRNLCHVNILATQVPLTCTCEKLTNKQDLVEIPSLDYSQAEVKEEDSFQTASCHIPCVLRSIIKKQMKWKKAVKNEMQTGRENSNGGKMLEAMSKFMEEATNLITNLNLVSEKLQAQQSYDLEVTVNEIKGLACFSNRSCNLEEAATQTSPFASLEPSFRPLFEVPVNKYDKLINRSCDKLEKCIDRLQTNCNYSNHSVSSSKYSEDIPAYHSLSSNQTFSDYGSLRKASCNRKCRCPPSTHLRQLTDMRKQLLQFSKLDFGKS